MSKVLMSLVATLFVAASSVSPMHAATTSGAQIEKNKQTARAWFQDIIIGEKLDKLDGMLDKNVTVEFAPGFVESASGMLTTKGIADAKKHIKAVSDKYDYTGEVVDVIAEGNKVCLLRTLHEKTKDGKVATFPWVTIFTFGKEGKITDMKHVHDTMSEHTQLATPAKK
jgi:hypothetical protein